MGEEEKKGTFSDQDQLEKYFSQASSDELNDLILHLTDVREQTRIREKEERKLQKENEKKERIREVISMELPVGWQNPFASDPGTFGVHADNPSDGLLLSLSNLGKVDIEYISAVTGEDCKSVICALKGTIYQNPDTWEECFYKGWEMADQYLSGNLKYKWEQAKKANKLYCGYFEDNLKALKSVQPSSISFSDIYITLGSPWVPTDVIDDFMVYLFGTCWCSHNSSFNTKHDEWTGTWEIPEKSRYDRSVLVTQRYGTERMEALYILEKALNMQTPAVYDFSGPDGEKSRGKRTLNQAETLAAVEKQNEMVKIFQGWVWSDEKRKARLTKIYEDRFFCIRKAKYDGSWLTVPGMSADVELYPYQKDAVARIILTPNTLLAHEVGAGKTYVMIAAGMELRRMGLSGKNLYVVPNNLIDQWKTIFLKMYPKADLLCVEPKNFTPDRREKMLEVIRDRDFDGIIMAYSCFGEIPLSTDYHLQMLREELTSIQELKKEDTKNTSALKKRESFVYDSISKLMESDKEAGDGVFFDELGITRLFVDEAHNYKNIPVRTKMHYVLGINTAGSAKCTDMMDKVRCVQQHNGGGGVVMATGTPITNSITDLFVMQKYLQNDELTRLGLESFDSWIGMFAEKSTDFEIDVDTSSYRLATRFARFHNLPELTNLLALIADFHSARQENDMPLSCEYHDERIEKTAEFETYLRKISQRAELVRDGMVSRRKDNMLLITTDGRKAALDMRLVRSFVPVTDQNKVSRCAERITEIYRESEEQRLTQLVFCDTSVPKTEFNLYDELKRLLIAHGIPSKEIAFVHQANTEKKRSVLFRKVREGEIRVLIGSTFKLGLGVNIQDRLIALHHLDVPWRPADMIQREGRILRPGNHNLKVHIYRYITEGSFDAYSWQLLEAKQHVIAGLLSSSVGQRSSEDVQDTVLQYAEVKALAVGNPLIRERVETENELNRYLSLQKKLMESRADMKEELLALPNRIREWQERIDCCKSDMDFCGQEKEKTEDTGNTKELKNYRKEVRQLLHKSVEGNVLSLRERVLMNYRGFDIILPANMTPEKPFVWIKRKGKYIVNLGDSETGDLTRVDYRINHLDALCKKYEENREKLLKRKKSLEKELENHTDYSEQICRYREKLSELDIELGVKES